MRAKNGKEKAIKKVSLKVWWLRVEKIFLFYPFPILYCFRVVGC